MNRRDFIKNCLYFSAAAVVPANLANYGFKDPVKVSAGNNFDSSFTKKLMSAFLEKFEENRMLQIKGLNVYEAKN